MKKTLRNLLITASASTVALTFCVCPTLHAQLLNVKIGQTSNDYVSSTEANGAYQESPAAVLGSANGWWNEYAFVASTPSGVSVVDSSDNTFSGITLSVANSQGVGSVTVSGGNPSFLMGSSPYMNSGGTFTISLTGLSPTTQYEFVGYAAYPSSNLGASWAVTTGTLNSGTTLNDGSSADISTGDGVAYSHFYATTDGSGNLTITDTSSAADKVFLNGFQLQAAAVPEPSSMALLGMAGAAFFIVMFRRRRARA